MAYRGYPAAGGQCLHRRPPPPPPRMSTTHPPTHCHIGLHGCPPPFAPPSPLVKINPLALGKKSTSKKTKQKKGLQPEKEKKDPLMHRERGALESAAFKISPYKLGGRPLQGLRPGAMAPLPPPRHATVSE